MREYLQGIGYLIITVVKRGRYYRSMGDIYVRYLIGYLQSTGESSLIGYLITMVVKRGKILPKYGRYLR